MLGYGALASRASASQDAPSTTASAKVPHAIELVIFRIIDSLLPHGFLDPRAIPIQISAVWCEPAPQRHGYALRGCRLDRYVSRCFIASMRLFAGGAFAS